LQRINALLERFEVDQVGQTLGLWIALNGNQYRQVLELIAKVLEWADKIRTEVWLSLRMGIAKALQYLPAATNMSKAECKLIDKKLIQAALPALASPPPTHKSLHKRPQKSSALAFRPYGINRASSTLQPCYATATARHTMSPDA
jgi:hypothetical protein